MDNTKTVSYRPTIYACYLGNVVQAAVMNVTPILFIPLKEQFGLSYSHLGILVLVNFLTQVCCDILFSNAADRYGFRRFIVCAPILATIGFILFALSPILFPAHPFIGFLMATVIFSGAGGLLELLLSPIINAIPSEEKISAMSFLHASYSWGQAAVILITTLLLKILSRRAWTVIVLLWGILPLIDAVLFSRVPLADGVPEERRLGMKKLLWNPIFLLCIVVIAAGGAAENAVSQWASSYLERGIRLPKLFGDLVGGCGFALTMGIGRTLYGKLGAKLNTAGVMQWGTAVLCFCFLLAALSPLPWISLLAFALCGIAVSLLWPGTLLVAADFFPLAGAWMFAILAAGGDIGSAFGVWLLGVIADWVPAVPALHSAARFFGITAEQMGLRAAILVGSVFPLIGFLSIWRLRKKKVNNTASDRKG